MRINLKRLLKGLLAGPLCVVVIEAFWLTIQYYRRCLVGIWQKNCIQESIGYW